jgi:O-antigen ligase
MHIIVKITIIFVLVLSASFILQKTIDNFTQESRGSSLQLRQQQLIFSIIQIANKPLFGNGVSYLTKNIFETDAYGDRIRDEEIMGMESIVFPKLINYGFIGFGTYLLLSAWIFLYFYRRRELHPMTQSGYLLIFSITMFFILTGNMGNASAYSYMILGVLMGCTQTLEKESKEEEDEPKQIESGTAQQDVG